MIIPKAPSVNNSLSCIIPPDTEVIDKQLYYVVSRSGINVYDVNNIFYGISNGYSRIAHTSTPSFTGAICIDYNDSCKWIQGKVKYLFNSICVLYDINFC